MKDICIIIPVFNESDNLENVLKKIPNEYDVLIVNDGSTDNTLKIINQHTHNFINHKKNYGYDYSLRTGFENAVSKGYKFIATFDGDNELSVTDLIKVVETLKKNNSIDIVLGSRDKVRRISEKFLNLFFKKYYRCNDILCGLKAYRVSKIKEFNISLNFNYTIGTALAIRYMKKKCRFKMFKIKVNLRKGDSRFGDGLLPNLKILLSSFYIILFLR